MTLRHCVLKILLRGRSNVKCFNPPPPTEQNKIPTKGHRRMFVDNGYISYLVVMMVTQIYTYIQKSPNCTH